MSENNYGPLACKHGHLKRSCEICDLQEQLDDAEREHKKELTRANHLEQQLSLSAAKVERLEGEVREMKEKDCQAVLEYKSANAELGMKNDQLRKKITELVEREEELYGQVNRAISQLHLAIAQRDEAQGLYNEIIYQVGNKFPGESRHETAVRYIKERESHVNQADTSAGTGEGKE